MHAKIETHEPRHLNKAWRYFLFVAVALVGYYLIAQHRAHVLAVLPFLLLAACPLLHLFMHRGHGRKEDVPGSGKSHSAHH